MSDSNLFKILTTDSIDKVIKISVWIDSLSSMKISGSILNPSSSIMREKFISAGPTGKPVLTMVPDYTPGVTYLDGKRVDASQHFNKADQTFVSGDLSAGFNDAELAAAVAASK